MGDTLESQQLPRLHQGLRTAQPLALRFQGCFLKTSSLLKLQMLLPLPRAGIQGAKSEASTEAPLCGKTVA